MTFEIREKRSHLPISVSEELGSEHILRMGDQGGYELDADLRLVGQFHPDHPTLQEVSDTFDLRHFHTS